MRLVVLVVFVLATTSCQAEHECQNPKEITEDFTPVFDFGDNWSFEDCGLWSNRGVAAPWRVAVGLTDAATCFGILLSNYDFVTSACKEVAEDFLKAPNGVKAYTGMCYDQKLKSTDAPSAECTGLEVKGVAAVGKDSDETRLYLWRLKAAAPQTTPICLFNANQKQKAGYGVADDYLVFDREWQQGRVVASVGGAPRSSQTSALCVKIGRNHNNAYKNDFYGDFLVKEVRGRMTLRGFFFWPVAEKLNIYTEVAPFIKQLVAKSHNMFIMPQVPPPKTKTDFSKASTLNKKDECGVAPIPRRRSRQAAHVNGVIDYMIGGVPAKRDAYPWHASLSYRPNKRDVAEDLDYCGATLISSWVVLTAAHCFGHYGSNATDFQIILGMHNTSNIIESDAQYMKAEKIEVHPEYNNNTKVYDVALLFLEEEVNVTSYVRPICLWDDDYSMDKLRGKRGTVVGWGTTENEDATTKQRKPSDILLEGHLSVLDHQECYVQEKVFYRKYLHPGVTFCAGGVTGAQNKSVAACRGDSGGGFIIPKGSKWYLRGVVSFGVNKKIDDELTCNENYPSLYVDLGSCMDWIVQKVAKKN